ncbi:MAG: FeoB-associated Cys-rich membrane protein [Lachnospiraceae bacterium]|nr:FeoB-associated Cys-rich membrane protein [Lachnospiraceae bacterium]
MTPTDILIAGIILVAIGAAVFYIRKEKKSGARCIGCPDSKTCAHNCAGCTGNCASAKENEK